MFTTERLISELSDGDDTPTRWYQMGRHVTMEPHTLKEIVGYACSVSVGGGEERWRVSRRRAETVAEWKRGLHGRRGDRWPHPCSHIRPDVWRSIRTDHTHAAWSDGIQAELSSFEGLVQPVITSSLPPSPPPSIHHLLPPPPSPPPLPPSPLPPSSPPPSIHHLLPPFITSSSLHHLLPPFITSSSIHAPFLPPSITSSLHSSPPPSIHHLLPPFITSSLSSSPPPSLTLWTLFSLPTGQIGRLQMPLPTLPPPTWTRGTHM
ncbi:unnamed protein product [Pleuronectes platessa]|uniref:Uncharacterized protein n=1 Tax=Pleuronectes platessa TaxID=8262 RepID=A0A9N7Y9E9_PLEPL|nr:unnamed protein product [Pleuronectes platessa]